MRLGRPKIPVKQNEVSGFTVKGFTVKGKLIMRPSPASQVVKDPAFPKSTLVPEMRWTDPKPTHNMLETHLARGWVL